MAGVSPRDVQRRGVGDGVMADERVIPAADGAA
ncbi:hypothetical protein FHX46_003301 [Amycolatopsis viridis]|uniref:Uncharacterized protein n=1 Tax=Amycolatopsis viridis TaxID=185678 RepID=A0ABX0SUX5_9PSEU|nr:hypothetical protein [Amycolatopsis viridis]